MLEPVLRQAQRDFDAHLERLQRYIRQPSVSAENRGIDETAAMIASGKGILGTNREYLVQLATQLDALGIDDPYVVQLRAAIGATPDM